MKALPVILSLLITTGARAGTLAVRILDERGKATPARVYLTDSAGRPRSPVDSLVYSKVRGDTEEHFVPRSGAFEIELEPGDWRINIERGKEYRPVVDGFGVPRAGRVERTYRLEPWVRMTTRGWYSGDMHLHRTLRDTAVLMEAEDLNVAIPITRWRAGENAIAEDPDLREFLSRSDARGALNAGNRWFTVLNEELESHASALLASGLEKQGSTLEYPFAEYGRALRKRGALVDSEKATSLELPVIAALGGCDVVGLANNHFWRAGSFSAVSGWGAWPDQMPRKYPASCAGFALAGFEVYYKLLNMGLPLKLSAGSASGVHPVPPGWSRIYAHVPGSFTVERWFEAVKAGRSFVTTGPMLLLRVNGVEPGEESPKQKFPLEAEVRVQVLSSQTVGAVELVVNGQASRLSCKIEPGGAHTCSTRLTLHTTSWIAARWLADSGKVCGVAHTAPVYFRNGDQAIPVPRADAEYLLRSVDALIRDAEIGRPESGDRMRLVVNDAELRVKTLRLFREARDIYESKLRQAN